jgi:hypothetical protein
MYRDRYAMRGNPADHPKDGPTVFATHSTHKLLAALSQTSFIHIRDGRGAIDHGRFNEAYCTQASTSPLYALIASNDVAALVTKVATMAPANGMIELAGPERIGLDDLVRRYLATKHDTRKVVTDVHARYFGTELNDKSLTPGDNPNIGSTSFEAWLAQA